MLGQFLEIKNEAWGRALQCVEFTVQFLIPRRVAPNKNSPFGFSPRRVFLYVIHLTARDFSLPACSCRVGRNQVFPGGDDMGHAFDIRFLCFSSL